MSTSKKFTLPPQVSCSIKLAIHNSNFIERLAIRCFSAKLAPRDFRYLQLDQLWLCLRPFCLAGAVLAGGQPVQAADAPARAFVRGWATCAEQTSRLKQSSSARLPPLAD